MEKIKEGDEADNGCEDDEEDAGRAGVILCEVTTGEDGGVGDAEDEDGIEALRLQRDEGECGESDDDNDVVGDAHACLVEVGCAQEVEKAEQENQERVSKHHPLWQAEN